MSVCRNTINGHLGVYIGRRLSTSLPQIRSRFPELRIVVVPEDDPELDVHDAVRLTYIRDRPGSDDGMIRSASFI